MLKNNNYSTKFQSRNTIRELCHESIVMVKRREIKLAKDEEEKVEEENVQHSMRRVNGNGMCFIYQSTNIAN